MTKSTRPTKKQRELLEFIEEFINKHGYSPSYREIMNGCNYNSVATVALHVNNLIKRGHLQKRDNSARSLEVITQTETSKVMTNKITESEEKWLIKRIEYEFVEVEQATQPSAEDLDKLYVLIGALKVLKLDGAAHSFIPRLTTLKNKISKQ